MKECECEIKGEKTINDSLYFVVQDLNGGQEYVIPTEHLKPFGIKLGDSRIFYREYSNKHQKFFLRLKQQLENSFYKIGEVYEFVIKEFEERLTKKNNRIPCLIVEDVEMNFLTVSGRQWQTQEIWKYPTIKCMVERFNHGGSPVLINKDDRHPIYEVGKEYEFKVTRISRKLIDDKEYNFYELLGGDNCIHQVNMHPGQVLNQQKPEYIRCQVVDITYRLKLIQVNIGDPFFVPISNILKDEKLAKKHFDIIFKGDFGVNSFESHLRDQYNSKSAFWVFTFTDKVLARRFREAVVRQDFKLALEINSLIIVFEKWIISKGIITSLSDELIRENTQNKAKRILESAEIINKALGALIADPFNFLEDDNMFLETKDSLILFFYLIKYSNVKIINEKLFISKLIWILDNNKIDSDLNQNLLKNFSNLISNRKKQFLIDLNDQYFHLTSSVTTNINYDEVDERKYLYWSFGELLIAKAIHKQDVSNILTGQILRRLSNIETSIENKHSLLVNAYKYLDDYQNDFLHFPFVFENELLVNYLKLSTSQDFSIKDSNDWIKIEEAFDRNLILTVRLTKKSNVGFEVEYNKLKGFLPNHHITNRDLKRYPFEKCDITINVRCIAQSKSFNYFIVQQLLDNEDGYFYENHNFKPFIIGEPVNCIIKKVVNYGLFVTAESGEGLIHISDIFYFEWTQEQIFNYFEEKQEIKAVTTKISSDGKVYFSFKAIKEIDPRYYDEYVEKLKTISLIGDVLQDSNDERGSLNSYFDLAQREKAFCFEQYAVLQTDINEKLNNFRLAKQFYSNSNNARSYLINIYTSYFEILLRIQDCIKSKKLKNIAAIKKDAIGIKERITAKTLETFPDSEKLIYFLDIIGLFNEVKDTSIELLYSYILIYSKGNGKEALKTIAKITLANNLLISESGENAEFSLRNLNLIFHYISSGVLSLNETEDDKFARELKAKVNYLRDKIKEEEGENLEFKSSFFTPVLDPKSLKKLEHLERVNPKTDMIRLDIDRIKGDLAKKAIIHSALKTLCAFANTSGGVLLIGVSDEKEIIGLEREFLTLNKKDQNRDGFGKFFDDRIKLYLGESFSTLITREFVKFPEGDILVVNVRQSLHEVFLLRDEEDKESEQLYIRNLSSSDKLTGSELAKFIKTRHLEQIKFQIQDAKN